MKKAQNIFISHSSDARNKAIKFKELLMAGSRNLNVFLSSDWNSINAGTIAIAEIEKALGDMDHLICLITCAQDAVRPWICYEVGYARGRKKFPKIFVFGNITHSEIGLPLSGIQWVGTWDTNRWESELRDMGVNDPLARMQEFAKLFKQ